MPFRRQLQLALEKGIPYMVVLGEDEVERQVCQLKDVQANEQKEVSLKALPQLLATKTRDSSEKNEMSKLSDGVEAMTIGTSISRVKTTSSQLTIGDNGRFHRPTGL